MVANINLPIAIASIKPIPRQSSILHPQRQNTSHRRRRQVHYGDRIILLQRHHRRRAIGGHRHKLRLQILSHRCIGTKNPNTTGPQRLRLAVKLREASGRHGRLF